MYENKDFSNCVKELEIMFNMINDRVFAVKAKKINLDKFITIASQGKRACFGWCSTVPFWVHGEEKLKYEINIASETLGRDIADTFLTLVHEMVHLYNAQEGIKDTSGSSGRHNKQFKATCDKIGLNCVDSGTRIGYTTQASIDKSSKLLQDTLADYVKYNHSEYLAISRIEEKGKITKKRKSNQIKYICPCCGTSVRATRTVCVKCVDCDEVMERAGLL